MGSFAAGKGSALVVDIGQSMASVTPVVDGFVLRKGKLPQLLSVILIRKSMANRPAIFGAPQTHSRARTPPSYVEYTTPPWNRSNSPSADC